MTEGSPQPVPSAPPRATRANGNVAVALGLLAVASVAFFARYRATHSAAASNELSRAGLALSTHLRPSYPRFADEIQSACKKETCACAERAAVRGLDANAAGEVQTLLALAGARCTTLPSLPGMRAEALLRGGQSDTGEAEARRTLATAPNDPFALYASALHAWRSNRLSDASALAQRSFDAGRGNVAQLLVGLIAYGQNQLDLAETAFRKALVADASDVEAAYNLALVHQRRNQYLAAREGYLRVLRLSPAHVNARYNLAILAHSIGADAEAKHHLERLRQTSATPEQIGALTAALATPAQNAPPSASSRNFALVLGAGPANSAGVTANAEASK
jgi:tetratricopeptide (TPR) repeat protein